MWKKYLELHFLVFLWGFTGIVGKLIGFGALELVFWRTFFTIITLFIVAKIFHFPIKVQRKNLIQFLLTGTIIGLHWVLFFGAIKVSNIAVALSTLSTGVLFGAFLEPLFFRRKIAFYEIFLALIVILCVYFIFQTNQKYWLGILMGLVCSFLSALFAIFNSFLQRSHNAYTISFYEIIGGFIIVSVSILLFGDVQNILNFQHNDFWWLLILAAGLTAFPMVHSTNLLKYISPYTMLLSINLEPVYGIFLGYFIFGESEQMSWTFYIVCIVMILVVVLNQYIKYKIDTKEKKL